LDITAPLKLEAATEATMNLPRFVDSNFAVAGDQSLRLRSKGKIDLAVDNMHRTKTLSGEELVTGTLKDHDLSGNGLAVSLQRDAFFGSIALPDLHSKNNGYAFETIVEVPAKVPSHLVVVVDGSESVQKNIGDITASLAKLPGSISTSVIVASDETGNQLESLPLS